MKTPGAVYKKLKQVKFHHLIALYRKHLKKTPENCKYNYLYELRDKYGNDHLMGLCFLHQDRENITSKTDPPTLCGIAPHLLDICQSADDCQNCNAFVRRYDREAIKVLFERELSTKSIRETKYPDICALEWVLERYSVEVPPWNNLFQRLIYEIKKILKHKQE